MALWGKRPGLFVNNIRFYILVISALLSLGILCLCRLSVASDELFIIRVQQVFGFTALGFWYLALLATPLSVVVGKNGPMALYLHARRALGVSAAYFAVLHMLTGIFGQLGGVPGLLLLPGRFQLALVFGAVGLLVLLAMAVTSFDSVIRWMTFPRWKWLHRLGYGASVFVLLHVWIIGTHLEQPVFRWVIFILLGILAVLESWRISLQLAKRFTDIDQGMRIMIFLSLCAVFLGLAGLGPRTIDRFHESHTGHGASR